MTMTWAQARGWRLRRHHLANDDDGGDGGAASIEQVVTRLIALPSWSGDATTAIRLRLRAGADADVTAAISAGRIFSTYAFRGTTHLMTPETAAVHLAIRCAGRQWELASWRSHYGVEPGDWPRLRATVREALRGGPLTQRELADAVSADPAYRHLREAFAHPSHTFLKPFGWQGDLCFSPSAGPAAFRSLESIPGWSGLAELDEAGPAAVRAYLGAYGPATADRLHYWLGEGLSGGRRRIDGWIAALGDDLVHLDIEGDHVLGLAEHADEITRSPEADGVVLLPGSDQWVLGAGTSDPHVVPPEHRAPATRGANLALLAGVVAGTWSLKGEELSVAWFGAAPPAADTERAVAALARATGRDLALAR